ncbi:MAG: peptidase M22 [Clostridia bacterium]|jgi:N6-L-threonylcarbamoyladenine synthase|nr:peptidase M22 [Clostridia bacterium]MBT7123287.1 peptidase M22 [Clostridia bacterium]
MKPKPCFLAIDTSAYTTSIALVSEGKVIADKRIMLNVPKGSRGLRQSEAVFAHIKNAKQLFLDFEHSRISAVGYSAKPCERADSYMPVFCVGESLAVSIASTMGVKAIPLTHQHGHIYSAFVTGKIKDETYCAFHVSGGTLDLLKVEIEGKITSIEKIGGTLDITCGQLIDRVGVAAGLTFPSGKQMESMYVSNDESFAVNVDGLYTNLSGAETQSLQALSGGRDIASVCSGVIDCVAETLSQLIRNADMDKYIFTGGVMCNNVIREAVNKTCTDITAECIMTDKMYCSDNACGVALGTQIIYNKGE